MTTPLYYVYPFGQTADDLTAIPIAAAGDGSVSYFAGWTDPYEYNLLTNPAALPIPRGQMNQLFFDITNNIQEYQQYGTPQFVPAAQNLGSPVPYPIFAKVYYNGAVYQNLVAANTAVPGVDNSWVIIRPSAYIADTSGSANTLTLALTPAPFAYFNGMTFQVLVANANTGATVVNVAGLGNVALVYTSGAPLIGGEMVAGGMALIEYTGSGFQLLNPIIPNIISSVILQGSSVGLTTTAAANVTQISLPVAGKWLVFGNVYFTSSGGSMLSGAAWVSTTSATPPDQAFTGLVSTASPVLNSNGINTPFTEIITTGVQTVYLSALADFSVPGTITACGGIYAVKVG